MLFTHDLAKADEIAEEMARNGFDPCWVEDLTEGMWVALEIGNWNSHHFVFGRISDIRSTKTIEIEYDEHMMETNKRTPHEVFRFMVLTEDGVTYPASYGLGWALFVDVEKSLEVPAAA